MFKFNPLTGELDVVNPRTWPVYASDPSDPTDGLVYINSTTFEVKVWYYRSWNVLHTLEQKNWLLQETGDALLLENGDNIILEQ